MVATRPAPLYRSGLFLAGGGGEAIAEAGPSPQTYARSINDSEVIVGFSEGVGVEATALVWLNGNVYSLTELISPIESLRPYVRLRHAWKVNNPADPRRRVHRRARARRFRALSAHAGAGTRQRKFWTAPDSTVPRHVGVVR